ncbi:hypothetical protein K9M48_03775 [Candidatus Gracilibacteria bacterium]|nr:hypothetical protein [Candidatus Gracilibacteria bacterium]
MARSSNAGNYAYNRSFGSEFDIAERNIDRHIKSPGCFMRKLLVSNGFLTEAEMNMYINSLLTDNQCKDQITDGYDMKHIDDQEILFDFEKKHRPLFRLEQQQGKPAELDKIENIKKRFLDQKKKKSYDKSPNFINKEHFEEKYKSIVKNFDTRDVALNNIIEFAIADLLEDIINDYIKSQKIKDMLGVKVYKTNEYDDVTAKTDFIIEIEYPSHKEYGAYDLTTSHSSQNLENKEKLKSVFCPHFHFNNRIKFAIPRSLIVLNDQEIIFSFFKNYMNTVMTKGKVENGEALSIFEKTIPQYQSIEKNIKDQLFSNIGLN